jgi:type IV pilus biogenesis protein CpaD/CtpE
MKRSRAFVLVAAAATLLGGCQSGHTMQAQAPRFDTGEPAYIQMSAGDRLGSVMIEDRIDTARLKDEHNAYAVVEPQFEQD